MEEEEYLQSLQPMLPTGPVYLDNAVTSRNIPDAQRSVYDEARTFSTGQAAARLLKRGLLPVNGSHDYSSRISTFGGMYRDRNAFIAAHFPNGTIRRVDEDTPISETMGADSFAVVSDRLSPSWNFQSGATWVKNKVGDDFVPDLEGYRDISGVPEEDKRNAYAHQLINGLRSTLRAYGVTDDELRSMGIDGYGDIDANVLQKLSRKNPKVLDALEMYLGQSRTDNDRIMKVLNDVDNFIRANYRPGVHHIRPEGVPERTRLYAKGGAMPKAAPERIRHEGRVLSRVGGNDREDWYL